MEANPVRAIQYFDGTKQNVIPLFQRQYTWSREKWQTLWEDVLAQYELEGTSTHFMGAVVSLPITTVPIGVNKHLIIDGQQRLTTLALLLCALREVLDNKIGARIEDYLVNRHYDGAERLKLVPTHGDREAFAAIVEGDTSAYKEHQMFAAYEFFKKAIAGNDLNGEAIAPDRLLLTIEQSLQVVMINLGDADDPYLIFESLNHKGEPLTQADLVRNYVLMRFPHSIESKSEQEQVYFQLWKPIQDSLGTALPEFLRHYAMKNGDDIKKGGIYAAIKSAMAQLRDESEMKKEIAHLRRLAEFYERFIDPAVEPRAEVRGHLEMFRELDVTTCYPLLLRLWDAADNQAMSDNDLAQCLACIESFVVRRSVCGVPTNSLKRLFLQWSKNLPSKDHYSYLLAAMASGTGNQRWPSDEEFAEAFETRGQYARKATRPILKRLEGSFRHKEKADLSNCTIEHVMPQTLTPEWRQMLGPAYEQIHTRLLDSFGNLTLTAYNVELGNQPFAQKRKKLVESHIELNRWIVEQDEWTEEVMIKRSKVLAKRAVDIWKCPAT